MFSVEIPENVVSRYSSGVNGRRGRSRVHAGRVGVVGLVENVVEADLFERVQGRRILEPPATIDLAAEVLARKEVVFRVLDRYSTVFPLPVHALEREWDPADTALDRHEIQAREAVTDSTHDQQRHGQRVGHEEGGALRREIGVQASGLLAACEHPEIA